MKWRRCSASPNACHVNNGPQTSDVAQLSYIPVYASPSSLRTSSDSHYEPHRVMAEDPNFIDSG